MTDPARSLPLRAEEERQWRERVERTYGAFEPHVRDEIIRRFLATLDAARASTPTREHVPGEHHHYRLECTVCGQFGVIRVSVDPERAPEEPSDD